MSRRVVWFSCGAPSALAAKLSAPDVIAYCETGSEHPDNQRFARDVEQWTGMKITRLKSEKYSSTWDVWEHRKYISGINGAPCTHELKVAPRLAFERPDDIHIFGYATDADDVRRANALQENWPHLTVEYPLIERGLDKAACLALVERAGIKVPVTYALGMPNANCIPCGKATSPAYYALIRKHFPAEFGRFAKLCRKLNVRAARVNNKRIFVDEIPDGFPTTAPIMPECDMLCSLAEHDMHPELQATVKE